MRKTKIVCTIGPASSTAEVMTELLKAGLNVARFNFSHGTHESQGEVIDTFRAARDRLGMAAAVLLDTKGPEMRLKNFRDGSVTLSSGDKFTLTTREVEGDASIVSVSYAGLPAELTRGDVVLINDGLVSLTVDDTTDTDVICTVVNGGKLSNHKGINIPNVDVKMDFVSERDKSDLLFGIEKGVDYIAASFTRSADDVNEMRRFLCENGGADIKIIAKIESTGGIKNFDEILAAADGIMVARGDLGVELAYEQLPGFQKRIIRRCIKQGKPVITATQMLESMTSNPIPTRAEISDVANAVFDGTTAVMLSEESAAGKYPVEAVRTMATIAAQAEIDNIGIIGAGYKYDIDSRDTTNAVGHAACTLAADIKAKAILAITASGTTATRIAKFRPGLPIIGITTNERVYHRMALLHGVTPLLTAEAEAAAIVNGNGEDVFEWCAKAAEAAGLIESGDTVVLTAGVPFGKGNTNCIRVLTVE